MKGFDEYYDEAVEPGKRERAFAWPLGSSPSSTCLLPFVA